MDKEILYINSILSKSSIGLTSSEISKLIFEKYDTRISRTIVKNYLWSYFRSIIKYDSVNYTYKLTQDLFLLDDIVVRFDINQSRALSSKIEGGKIIITADRKFDLEKFIRALGVLNFKIGSNRHNLDIIKQLNRVIEQLTTT